VTLLGFSYRGGGQAALRWGDSGCQEVDNGNLAAFQMNSGFGVFQSAVDAVAPRRLVAPRADTPGSAKDA
jgi:hypothetical protein